MIIKRNKLMTPTFPHAIDYSHPPMQHYHSLWYSLVLLLSGDEERDEPHSSSFSFSSCSEILGSSLTGSASFKNIHKKEIKNLLVHLHQQLASVKESKC